MYVTSWDYLNTSHRTVPTFSVDISPLPCISIPFHPNLQGSIGVRVMTTMYHVEVVRSKYVAGRLQESECVTGRLFGACHGQVLVNELNRERVE